MKGAYSDSAVPRPWRLESESPRPDPSRIRAASREGPEGGDSPRCSGISGARTCRGPWGISAESEERSESPASRGTDGDDFRSSLGAVGGRPQLRGRDSQGVGVNVECEIWVAHRPVPTRQAARSARSR